MKFNNPVLSGFYPDPTICAAGDYYYLATSTFEYFPGVPLFKSDNLVNWELVGHCLTRRSQLDLRGIESSKGIFAPTLRFHNGRFYMVSTVFGRAGHFYVTAEKPEGPWSEPIWVQGEFFDPDIFFDDDGKVYFAYMGMGRGIVQFEIDIETGKALSDEKIIWRGHEDRFCEGPHLYKIGSWYYLIVAEGGTHRTHMIACARALKPTGPFTGCPHNPLLTHRCAIDNPIFHTGHGDLIQYKDGSWWIVFLGCRPHKTNFHLGRETFLAPVKWTETGWPVINDGKYIELEMDASNLPVRPQKLETVRDDFDGDTLGNEWVFRRNHPDASWYLSERPGYLRLYGTENPLSSRGAVAFVGRRQKHLECSATVSLEFRTNSENEEAGLTILCDDDHHYDLGVRFENGGYIACLTKTIGDIRVKTGSLELAGPRARLRIEADKDYYVFYAGDETGALKKLGTGMTRYLASHIYEGFTGVFFGMYATGNGCRAVTPADFDWFEYVPVKT